jgi:hypothetical protein
LLVVAEVDEVRGRPVSICSPWEVPENQFVYNNNVLTVSVCDFNKKNEFPPYENYLLACYLVFKKIPELISRFSPLY